MCMDESTPSTAPRDFWAVSQAESARNATQRRRFPRSVEPTANNPAENRTEVQDPWRNQRPFPAKPPRTRRGALADKAAAAANTDAGAHPVSQRTHLHPLLKNASSGDNARSHFARGSIRKSKAEYV